MEQQALALVFFLVVLVGIVLTIFRLAKRGDARRKRSESILSSIQVSDLESDTDAEIREIKNRRQRLYRLSSFKWLLSVVFSLILLFMATFEFWVPFHPQPEVGEPYPITLKAAYTFPFHRGISPRDDVFIKRGETILRRGEIVRQSDLSLLESYERHRRYPPFSRLAGYFVLFLIFTLLLEYWLLLFFPEKTESTNNKTLVFIFAIMFLVIAVAKFSFLTSVFSMYYVPLAMLGMLTTILVFPRIVPPIMIFSSLFIAIVSEFNIQLLLVLLGGSLISVFWLQRVKKRIQLISAGMAVGMASLVIFLGIELTRDTYLLSPTLFWNAFASLANGPASGFLALLLIPILEKVFGYTSPFRLMELADLDSDLLRELYLKAPGTYQHSLAVANLAEIAASEIGADALLLRVGAYYHDIGKMFKAKFYVENIGGQENNPHNRISPYASAKILKSHVSLGLEVGRKYGLPDKVLDLIPQHHGTTVMDYFVDKARKSAENPSISMHYFAYPGPKPRTREAAILMIVDSVEAASRVLADNSEDTVRKMIEQIIHHKFTQGQLDEAEMTLAEARRVTYALTKALSTSGHKRIDYPEESGGISARFNLPKTDPPLPTTGGSDTPAAPDPAPSPGEPERASG